MINLLSTKLFGQDNWIIASFLENNCKRQFTKFKLKWNDLEYFQSDKKDSKILFYWSAQNLHILNCYPNWEIEETSYVQR